MSQSGYTPILIYSSSTATNIPLAANLAAGELAINTADGILFYKDSSNVVQKIGYKLTPTTAGGTGLTSFTANGVVYASSTSALATGSALTFDGSKLLVSSSGEQFKLLSSGDFTSTGSGYIRWYDSVGSKGYLGYIGTANTMQLSTGGSGFNLNLQATGSIIFEASADERMRLTSTSLYTASGINVGIGTSSPGAKLEVYLADGTYVWARENSINKTVGYQIVANGGSPTAVFSSNTATGEVRLGGIATNYFQTFYTNNTERARIDSSGNLGIGTSSPASKLDVLSTAVQPAILRSSNATGGYLALYDSANSAYRGFIGWGSGTITGAAITDLCIAPGTSGATRFGNPNGSANYAIIDSIGNLLVGMTSTSGQSGMSIVPVSATYTAIHHATGSASGTEYALFRYNGGGIGSITQNGTTGVLYNLTSDYRLKNDQQALTGAKDFIMALKPKKWQWWDGSGEGVGFVAHEFMEVAKHSGNGEKDAVDSDGKPVYQSIQPSSSEVMANLVAFIQEQQALITQLTARITALESA